MVGPWWTEVHGTLHLFLINKSKQRTNCVTVQRLLRRTERKNLERAGDFSSTRRGEASSLLGQLSGEKLET